MTNVISQVANILFFVKSNHPVSLYTSVARIHLLKGQLRLRKPEIKFWNSFGSQS